MAYDNTQNTSSDAVPLGARAEMFPQVPLPDFNGAGGPAFAARLKGGEGATDLMGILCNTGVPVRLESANALRGIDNPSVLRLIDSGVVLWPHDNTRYFAFCYQRPVAPRLKHSYDEAHTPLNDDVLTHYFIAPLIRALMEFGRMSVVHNSIRPTNIFWRLGSATPPQLGECLSAPAGLDQPVLFEPLERALSLPMGRGPGHHSDDCYAFGVTLALMVLGTNPMHGMDDKAIIQMKLERGSFSALIGNKRLSAAHIEILRGLLTDDSRQRWTANDMELWLSGRRMTPKNTDAGRRASRHFEFVGKEYWQVRPLAAAFAAHTGDAVRVIEDGSLDKWLRRALADDDRAGDVGDAVGSLKESGKTANHEEQIVARTCIVLDPPSPIRYHGLSVMPQGIANMLVEAILTGNNVKPLVDIITSQLVTFWVEMQKEIKTELVPLGQQFERVKNFIEKSTFGNGIERVVYELNQSLPCLSPMLRSQYVSTPKAMLSALEHVASSGNRPREPMDRHIAAFLIVRDRRSELLFDAMMGPETSPRRAIALLTLFGEMQHRHGPDTLPGLAQWLAPLLEPSIQRYLGKGLKERLRTQMKDLALKGDLSALLRLLDDPDRIERDQQEFMAARMLYLNILKEINKLEATLSDRDGVARESGKPIAASLSSFLAILLVLAAVLRVVWQSFS